jgi:hypothetical protein
MNSWTLAGSSPAHDLFKFVPLVYVQTILDGKLYFKKDDDLILMARSSGSIRRVKNFLATCFSNEEQPFRNMEMWKQDYAGEGAGVCFHFFHHTFSDGGNVSGDLQELLKRVPPKITNPYVEMEGTKIYKIDNYVGESYSDKDISELCFDEETLPDKEVELLMLVKEKATSFENEVRFITPLKINQDARCFDFTTATRPFETRNAFIGPDVDSIRSKQIKEELRRRFKSMRFVYKVSLNGEVHVMP